MKQESLKSDLWKPTLYLKGQRREDVTKKPQLHLSPFVTLRYQTG